LTDYHINDEWILTRVMGQSSSFSQWFRELISIIEKSAEATRPEAAEEIRKSRDLAKLRDMDEKFRKLDEKLAKDRDKLLRLGSIGNFVSDLTSNIVKMSLEKSLGTEVDIDVDFLTGKRKTLSSALYDVTKERGINYEGILYLVESLPDLESFLYSTSVKKHYRDHTEHQLRVAVLGDFLLEQDTEQGTLLGIIAELLELDELVIKEKLWWIAGLIHDIGYPLSKMTTAVNWSLLNQILKCYPQLDLEVVPMEVTLSQKGAQKEYLKLLEGGLSKKARELIRMGAGFCEVRPVPQRKTFLGGDNGHPEYTFTSEIALDHGVIGALTLLKSLGTPEEIKASDEYCGYITAAKAIALHNFKDRLKDFIFEDNPLAFLLVLVDEIQEWGRPIPIQIRDSYFTTELKKVALLEEIVVTIDEFQWLMQYRNTRAKELINFDFGLLCNSKKKAFFRLDRGSKFQETTILLQDFKKELNNDTGEKGSQVPEAENAGRSNHKRILGLKRPKKVKEPHEKVVGEFTIRI